MLAFLPSGFFRHFPNYIDISRGAVHSAASSYAAMRMVAGSCPVLVIA